LQYHHYPDQPEDVRKFARRFAVMLRKRLISSPYYGMLTNRGETTPAKRLLVLLCTRTAVDAAVAHAIDQGKPVDATLAVRVMNLLMSHKRVRDLYSLRMTCKLTHATADSCMGVVAIALLCCAFGIM
jgi:hypothetical protein